MEKKDTKKYWIGFALSMVLIIAMLMWVRAYFWLALPLVCTMFVKAMNLIDDNKPEDLETY